MTRYPLPPRKPVLNPRPSPIAITSAVGWLNDAADYWLARGYVLVWHYDAREQRYSGFTAFVEATGQKVAEVKLFEAEAWE